MMQRWASTEKRVAALAVPTHFLFCKSRAMPDWPSSLKKMPDMSSKHEN
jgi:hypothetical protein